MATRRASKRTGAVYSRVTEGDLEVLVDHRHRMWSEIGNHTEREIAEHDSRYRAWALSRIRSGEVVGVVAAAPGGSVIASGCVWFRPDQPRPQLPSLISPYILSMYTAPDWRGRGVASRIVRDLVSVCRKAGYPNVDLHASKYGRSVYSRLRFDRTWEMRFWIDPRIRRRRARLRAKSQKRGSKGLDRAR